MQAALVPIAAHSVRAGSAGHGWPGVLCHHPPQLREAQQSSAAPPMALFAQLLSAGIKSERARADSAAARPEPPQASRDLRGSRGVKAAVLCNARAKVAL